jgi:hypothetical protein
MTSFMHSRDRTKHVVSLGPEGTMQAMAPPQILTNSRDFRHALRRVLPANALCDKLRQAATCAMHEWERFGHTAKYQSNGRQYF